MKWMINITLNQILAGFFILILINSCEEHIWDNPNDPDRNYYNYGSLSDIDGNVYKTIQIGTQIWMAENLKTTKYNDGTAIPNVTNDTEWSNLTTGAYCWYNNDIKHKAIYGALYNWYTVNTGKLCPKGWHVPTKSEWSILSSYLGGEYVAGGKLKSITDWDNPSIPDLIATNSSGFNALPGGHRYSNGGFNFLSDYGCWWSASNSTSNYAWYGSLQINNNRFILGDWYKNYGYSVRCIRD